MAKSLEEMQALYSETGVELAPEDWAFFERLRLHLITANATMNLTRLTRQEDFYLKHVLDSLLPFAVVPSLNSEEPGMLVADLGSGGGFPGIPIAYMHPSWDVALIERTQKKAAYLEETAEAFGLENVFVIPMDAAECASQVPVVDQGCDIVFARGVGRIASVTRSAAALLKSDGRIAHFKGGEPALDELAEGEQAAEELGMLQMEPVIYTLPPDAGRSIVLTLNLPTGRKRGATRRSKRATRRSHGGRGR